MYLGSASKKKRNPTSSRANSKSLNNFQLYFYNRQHDTIELEMKIVDDIEYSSRIGDLLTGPERVEFSSAKTTSR